MESKVMPAYVGIVEANHTVSLPTDVPVGATVAVIIIPKETPSPNDAVRQAHFKDALAAIRAAEARTDIILPPDAEIDELIERARKAK